MKDLPAIVSAMLVKPIPPALDASGEGLFTTVIPDNRWRLGQSAISSLLETIKGTASLVKPGPPAVDASGEGLFTTVMTDNGCHAIIWRDGQWQPSSLLMLQSGVFVNILLPALQAVACCVHTPGT